MDKAIVFYEFGDETWSTPHAIIEELKSRGIQTQRIHLLDTNIHKMEDVSLVLTMDWKGIDNPLINRDNFPNAVLMRECADTPQNTVAHLAIPDLSKYHVLLTPDLDALDSFIKKGYHNCIWWTHFADTRIYKKIDPSLKKIEARSTRGERSSQIMDLLSYYKRNQFLNINGLMGEEHANFLGGSIITIQHSRFGEITRRIFEGAACGNLVITDRLCYSKCLPFHEWEEIVLYDSFAELLSYVNYFLSPEGVKKAIEIGERAYKKVLTHHTQIQRVDRLLKEWYIFSRPDLKNL